MSGFPPSAVRSYRTGGRFRTYGSVYQTPPIVEELSGHFGVVEARQRAYRQTVHLRATIRAERLEDSSAVAKLVVRAYAAVPYSDHREHLMIERLRGSEAYVPELSLVAEVGNEVVGHILLTAVTIGDDSSATKTLALAPLSVVPEFQRLGVGKQLVRAAHERAAELGFGSILLVGIPGYYLQFGYQALSRYPITLPFQAPDENCMILPLRPGALDDVSGGVHYPNAWLDH